MKTANLTSRKFISVQMKTILPVPLGPEITQPQIKMSTRDKNSHPSVEQSAADA
jgi:hypothetical protein